MLKNPKNKKTLKWLLVAGGSLLLIGLAVYFYFATLAHDDTATLKAAYTVEAIPFIKEFEKDYKTANKKYAEKIIATTGSYLIFAFQDQHMAQAKKLKPGENVLIKGSCSDGIYSDILGTYFISFKRSTVENN